jgi:TRAP-type mannitol/chloroaromatic compound transport system permease small subunit
MKARLSERKWWTVPAAVLMVAMARNAHACATCGLSADDPKARAYLSSVVFMIAVPYTLCLIGAVVGFFAYRNARRRGEREINPSAPQPLNR